MKNWSLPIMALLGTQIFIASCTAVADSNSSSQDSLQTEATATYDSTFNVEAESFADIQVLRYQVPGFDQLSAQQKEPH